MKVIWNTTKTKSFGLFSNILKPFSFSGILTNLFFFNIEAKSIGIACAIAIYFNEDSEKKKESKT